MGFLRQARAGIVTSYCTLELVSSYSQRNGRDEPPLAIYQRVAFMRIQDEHSVPRSSPKVTIVVNVIIIIPIIFDITERPVSLCQC